MILKNSLVALIICSMLGCGINNEPEACNHYDFNDCTIVFESGFDNDKLNIVLNGENVFSGVISTDHSIEVAKFFEYSCDTVSKIDIIVNGSINSICPYKITTIDYKEGNLSVENLDEFPVYE